MSLLGSRAALVHRVVEVSLLIYLRMYNTLLDLHVRAILVVGIVEAHLGEIAG